jgi:UDPglucose 6-dehydrogenase
MCPDAYTALNGADGVVILTEWNEFRALDLEKTRALLKRPLMIDLRNIYKPQDMAEAGFTYISVGRTPVSP